MGNTVDGVRLRAKGGAVFPTCRALIGVCVVRLIVFVTVFGWRVFVIDDAFRDVDDNEKAERCGATK